MLKRILKNAGLVVFTLAFVLSSIVRAQEGTSLQVAKAAFEQGAAAEKQKDYTNAIAFYRKAIELDPNYVESHNNFKTATYRAAIATIKNDLSEKERVAQLTLAREKAHKDLTAAYEEWAQKDPRNSRFQWMLGELYQNVDYDKSKRHLLNAIDLDPRFVPAYASLALVAEAAGDTKLRLDSLKKAAELAPKDASQAFYYAAALRHIDPALYRKKAIEVAERFPNDDRGAQSLYWLAFESDKLDEKIATYERLKSSFPPEKYSWSESGMQGLFEAYSKTNPQKALALAEELSKSLVNEDENKPWQARAAYQKDLLQARQFINEEKYAEALALLEKTSLPRFINAEALYLLKAEALNGSGQTEKAYKGLLELLLTNPTDALQTAFINYAAKLNKTPQDAKADLQQALDAKAKPISNFSFIRYGDEKKVSLSDYRGKVVLLNFWYPYCGPCRGENPSLQKVLAKYGPDKFVILAVNVHPDENSYVLPYTKGNKFDFIPLRSNVEFAEKEFQARGYPANYLLDPHGRVVFKPGVTQGLDEERQLELQIEALLTFRD